MLLFQLHWGMQWSPACPEDAKEHLEIQLINLAMERKAVRPVIWDKGKMVWDVAEENNAVTL